MGSKVKRQHYVWRRYLRAWANEERIWTYFKEFNKVELVNLMGVAQEKYFYRLVDFTDAEEKFLRDFIDRSCPESLKALNYDFLALYTSTGKLKKQLDETTNPAVDREKYAEEINKLEINLMEYGHGKMELLGDKLLNYQSLDDLKKIQEDDYLFDAIMFLCFQYFRTRNMRNSVLQSFAGGAHEELADKSWNILCYVMSTVLARNISLDQNLKFIFVKNDTDVHFITSDQPVFNILNDRLNDQGEVVELEFYYPMTPQHALQIHFRKEQADMFIKTDADIQMVAYLNSKVLKNSDFAVFADSKEQLETYIE